MNTNLRIKAFFDCETTGINVYTDEIITAYFILENGDDYLFQSQVNEWSYDAERIHDISYEQMRSFPAKAKAWSMFIDWLKSKGDRFELVTFTNPYTHLGYINYDCAILKMELMNHLNLDSYHKLPFDFSTRSVYEIAKIAAKQGYFTPIKNDSGRDSFSQVNVYKALFDGLTYNAHDAFDDVIAMKKIYDKLSYMIKNNIKETKQGSLF